MSRLPSWFIVAAVGALVALAAADAIRPTGRSAPVTSTQSPRAAVRGMLVFAGPACAPSALRLPDLAAEAPPLVPDCGGTTWSDDGTLHAECRGRSVIVGSADGLSFGGIRGCAPAWRPDGVLSVIRDGNLVIARRHGRPQIFLSKEALADELEREIGGVYELAEVAWIDSQTFAAIVRGSKPWQQALVVGSQDRLDLFVPERGQRISSLSVSPLGNVAFARSRLGREFVMLARSGREIPLPRIANVRAIAWSPDEQWVALATRTSTFIARTGTRQVVLRIPVGGDALAWPR
jgi:hypothetical protein